MSLSLTPEPLTAEAFKPFGEVVSLAGARKVIAINEGFTDRYHHLADLDLMEEGGHPLLSIFRSRPKPLPLQLEVMERHPLGSQTFLPMSERPYLVVVAPPGEFRRDQVRAFLAAGVGVSYRRGAWHHYSLALEAISDFWVIDRGGPGDNLDEVRLSPRITIDLSGLRP